MLLARIQTSFVEKLECVRGERCKNPLLAVLTLQERLPKKAELFFFLPDSPAFLTIVFAWEIFVDSGDGLGHSKLFANFVFGSFAHHIYHHAITSYHICGIYG